MCRSEADNDELAGEPSHEDEGKAPAIASKGVTPPFDSYASFHRQTFGASITDARDALGVTFLRTSQPRGCWINAPTPDLVIGRCIGGRGYGFADIGAGQFHTTGRRGETLVMAPGVSTSFEIRDRHEVLILGLPYHRMLSLDPSLELPVEGDFGVLHSGSFEIALVTGLLDRIWQELRPRSLDGGVVQGAQLTHRQRRGVRGSRGQP